MHASMGLAAIIIAGMSSSFRVRRADWERDREHLRRIREAVFIREQRVPSALEWDGSDASCLHVLAEDMDGAPIGTGRLLPDGHIGRMAVLANWRGRGVGSAILTELVRWAAEQGITEVVLNAQTHALGFYQRHGFAAVGEVFLDAEIDHRRMRRVLHQTNVQASGAADPAVRS
jgi:predicted GNAT family N-acyltransferase